ncbi:sensor histidine kinase [Desulfatibacillum aliphaticivorans]|uniref:sensor histidine kinase n=1 Tax=Desulfatibacillum aliphaticivorans TaxID=218208 RepID=UPI0004130757|nr:HAMP domain-containing sensor histidine kinase [Desulfatibacillum aliphaticivorans]
MKQPKWFTHPVTMLVLSILALAGSLSLYIYWYVEASSSLYKIARMLNTDPAQFSKPGTWVVISVLSILVGVILLGILTIFVYTIQARRLYRVQRNFINNFTHELKTPVTSLKLYLETFQKHELPKEDQQRYLGYMVADIDRLSDNIARILNLAKIESKTYEDELILCDVYAFTESFLKTNSHVFLDSKITLNNPSGHMLPCRINQSLFGVLLMNLLTNAITYNESKIPEVEIRFEIHNKKLHIVFTDNGMGMEKRHFKRIFKKFYQIGRSDDMSAKGSGLGLFMTATIARIHNARIKASSKGLGQGSEFRLIMPFRW